MTKYLRCLLLLVAVSAASGADTAVAKDLESLISGAPVCVSEGPLKNDPLTDNVLAVVHVQIRLALSITPSLGNPSAPINCYSCLHSCHAIRAPPVYPLTRFVSLLRLSRFG